MSQDENTDVVRGAAGMPEAPAPRDGAAPSVDDLEEAMRDVVDPELGINVVDLGLLYDIRAEDGVATLDMTLTSAACPLTDVIEDQTRAALTTGPDGGLLHGAIWQFREPRECHMEPFGSYLVRRVRIRMRCKSGR
jgi:hypothetical protein